LALTLFFAGCALLVGGIGRKVSFISFWALISALLSYAALMVLVGGAEIVSPIERGASGRSQLWQWGVELWLTSPWFGIGPGMTPAYGMAYGSVHNMPLHFLLEFGSLFALVLLILFVRFFRCVLRLQNVVLRNSLVVSVVSILSYSLFTGLFIVPLAQMFGVLFVLVISFLLRGASYNDVRSESKGGFRWVLCIPAMFCLIVSTLQYNCSEIQPAGRGLTDFWRGGDFWVTPEIAPEPLNKPWAERHRPDLLRE